MHRSRPVLLLLLLAIALELSACGGSHRATAARPHPGGAVPAEAPAPRPGPGPPPVATVTGSTLPAGVTEVATLTAAAPASRVPGGPAVATVPQSWYGYPSVLPVIDRQPGWVEVREAQRPNGSTAWIPEGDATIATTAYRLVLHVSSMHLQEFRDGQPVADFPAGIGTAGTPTTPGNFFITMKAPPPTAAYGPFVLVTSAHSDVITDWEALGDAINAIHGPITAAADAQIGTTGARISNGCVRLHDADLATLAGIPAGTPFDVEG